MMKNVKLKIIEFGNDIETRGERGSPKKDPP